MFPRKGRVQGAIQLADRTVDHRPSVQIAFWGLLAMVAEHVIYSRALAKHTTKWWEVPGKWYLPAVKAKTKHVLEGKKR